MKLTFKITALFFAAAAFFIATNGYLAMQSEVEMFQQEMAERHAEIARDLPGLLNSSQIFDYRDPQRRNQELFSQRLVWLDDNTNIRQRPLAEIEDIGDLVPGELVSLPVTLPNGTEWYCSYFLLESTSGRLAAWEIAESYARRDAFTQGTLKRTLLQLVGLGLVAVVLVSLVGVRLVGQPLEALLRKTDRAAKGDLLSPIHVKGGDELSELADALNRMCESLYESQQATAKEAAQREAAVEQLRHADRLKTVGRLGAGIAHELGTPLNVVIGRASLIADGRVAGDDVIQSADVIRSEARRMTKLVDGLLNFARRTPANREACDVAKVVREMESLLETFAKKRGATMTATIECEDCDTYHADCAQLQQVISNLTMNAILSKVEGANVDVRLAEEIRSNPAEPEKGEQACLVIAVSDDGDGIADADRPHLFEPFFTTRDTGEGTGLGLSIVHGIVSEHDGWIEVDSAPGNGSTFTVCLPRPNAGDAT